MFLHWSYWRRRVVAYGYVSTIVVWTKKLYQIVPRINELVVYMVGHTNPHLWTWCETTTRSRWQRIPSIYLPPGIISIQENAVCVTNAQATFQCLLSLWTRAGICLCVLWRYTRGFKECRGTCATCEEGTTMHQWGRTETQAREVQVCYPTRDVAIMLA